MWPGFEKASTIQQRGREELFHSARGSSKLNLEPARPLSSALVFYNSLITLLVTTSVSKSTPMLAEQVCVRINVSSSLVYMLLLVHLVLLDSHSVLTPSKWLFLMKLMI